MKELALTFGPEQGLVGVVAVAEAAEAGVRGSGFGVQGLGARPRSERGNLDGGKERLAGGSPSSSDKKANSPKPGVVFWNAGLLHRVGASRLYVTLARELAAQGFASLRFDLSGRGDSAPPKGVLPERVRAIEEIQEAMRVLGERAGVNRFVLVGLCTGADQAHAVAVADARVVGLVCVDGYAYPTWGFWVRRVGGILLNRRRLGGVVRRLVRAGGGGDGFQVSGVRFQGGADGDIAGLFDWQFPPRGQVRADLEALAGRGAQMLYLYSGEAAAVFNHRAQFKNMFPGANFGDKVTVAFMEDADHLFALPGDRARFVRVVGDWFAGRF